MGAGSSAAHGRLRTGVRGHTEILDESNENTHLSNFRKFHICSRPGVRPPLTHWRYGSGSSRWAHILRGRLCRGQELKSGEYETDESGDSVSSLSGASIDPRLISYAEQTMRTRRGSQSRPVSHVCPTRLALCELLTRREQERCTINTDIAQLPMWCIGDSSCLVDLLRQLRCDWPPLSDRGE